MPIRKELRGFYPIDGALSALSSPPSSEGISPPAASAVQGRIMKRNGKEMCIGRHPH